jgi:putative transposase
MYYWCLCIELGRKNLAVPRNARSALHYHLVIVTKYRRRCLTAALLARFKEIASARCDGWGGRRIEVNGEPDHVHLSVSLPPNLDLSRFVNNIKTTTSRLVRKEFAAEVNRVYYPKPVLWSRSYCIVSCAGAPLSVIRQYIEQQEARSEARESLSGILCEGS